MNCLLLFWKRDSKTKGCLLNLQGRKSQLEIFLHTFGNVLRIYNTITPYSFLFSELKCWVIKYFRRIFHWVKLTLKTQRVGIFATVSPSVNTKHAVSPRKRSRQASRATKISQRKKTLLDQDRSFKDNSKKRSSLLKLFQSLPVPRARYRTAQNLQVSFQSPSQNFCPHIFSSEDYLFYNKGKLCSSLRSNNVHACHWKRWWVSKLCTEEKLSHIRWLKKEKVLKKSSEIQSRN